MVEITHNYTLNFEILDLSKEEVEKIWDYMKNYDFRYINRVSGATLEFRYINGDMWGVISLLKSRSTSQEIEEYLNKMFEYMNREISQYSKFKRYQKILHKNPKYYEILSETAQISKKYDNLLSEYEILRVQYEKMECNVVKHHDGVIKCMDEMRTIKDRFEDVSKCVEKLKTYITKKSKKGDVFDS